MIRLDHAHCGGAPPPRHRHGLVQAMGADGKTYHLWFDRFFEESVHRILENEIFSIGGLSRVFLQAR